MDENEKSRRVRDMFGSIARRYDFLNHFLSANFDRRWREACVREIERRIPSPVPRILDVGCGTGDLSLSFSRLGPVVGCDFCHPMLQLAMRKVREKSRRSVLLLEGDALALPFADGTFDIVVSAFVLRNLADIDGGLREMRRVLRPRGVMGFLEFGMPGGPLVSRLYRGYFLHLLPGIGKLISGVNGPYRYLPSSVQTFPAADQLKKRVESAGFTDVECLLLTGGVAVLLTANAA